MPKISRGVRTPPPPISAILVLPELFMESVQLLSIGQCTERARFSRRQGAARGGAAKHLSWCSMIQKRIDQTSIERIASPGSIHRIQLQSCRGIELAVQHGNRSHAA